MADKTGQAKKNNKNTNEPQNIRVQSWLSEYQCLARSNLSTWRQRYIFVGLNIAAMGTLISLAISTESPHFIAVLSLVSSALGLIWVAEGRWYIKLDNYLRDKIAPAMRALSQDPAVFGATEIRKAWAQNYRQLFKSIFTGGAAGALTGILIFFMPSAVSFGIAISEWMTKNLQYEPWYFTLLVAADAVLLTILVLSGTTLFKEWKVKPQKTQGEND